MNNNVFALSNNPSKSAFQPLEDDEYDNLLKNTRTPTTLTFKSSKAITNSIESIESKKEVNLAKNLSEQNNLPDFYSNEKSSSSKVKSKPNDRRREIEELDPVSSNSEPLPFQDYLDDCTSRSNSNCSGQSLFSDELSCSLTFNSTATVTKNPLIDLTNRLDSSIDSSSLYNKHLLFKIDKDSPQLLIGGNAQLPGGVCCVLSNKPVNPLLKESNENQVKFNKFDRLNDSIMSPEQDSNKQEELELLELPKRTKRKHKSRLKNQTSSIFNQQIDHSNPHTQLRNQQLNELLFANQEQQQQQLNASNENKPQFRFTRYDTVDTEDGGNHVNLLAIDHLPSQMVFQDNSEIANLNQARLIKTNLLKQKFANNTALNASQPQPTTTTINSQPNQLPSNLTNVNNLPANFAFLSKNKLGLIINQQQQQQPTCNCNELNKEINNNLMKNQSSVCIDCENTKKILQTNLVRLIPLSANQSCSTTNSNTSPLSIQISPLSAASSAQSRSTCSAGQLNSTTALTNQNAKLTGNISINQPPSAQAILASIASNQGNVFNYDPATIHQYALSLNQQQNFNNNLQQERTLSSLSGFSDPITPHQINSNLPTARSASSCAQYNLTSMQEPFDQNSNQFQPINPNFSSRSEQNLISSSANNRFYNSINNDNFINNQMSNQRQPFYSQQQIYDNTFNQINNQPNITTNRPYRHLSFRTPSPIMVNSSSLADSALESPSTSYVDNNQDSVNIFNTYSKYQSSSSNYFSSYLYNGPKEHNFFRKAVPTLPIVLAVLLCILNWFLPGSGKF